MKNVIKKIAAFTMAFTLLGTGTTIAKTVNPKSVITLSAHAACNHVPGSTPRPLGNWVTIEQTSFWVINQSRTDVRPCGWFCTKCGAYLCPVNEYRRITWVPGEISAKEDRWYA